MPYIVVKRNPLESDKTLPAKGIVYIPYYQLVFKNDLIQYSDNIKSVISASYNFEWSKDSIHLNIEYFKPDIVNKYDTSNKIYSPNFYLYKRPFINWIKYFFVLLTKRYIK
jgi:hypothetical protein